ncbi:MAG: HAMP domain-containing protein, partial [Acidiferrobacterales bacterium]|nr:HAMP domain-containing protein [Acidiferrobacterales bacterium]
NAEQISKGDFKQQIDLSRQDEIGYLGATIDRMQYGLRVAAMRLRQNVAKPV